MWRGNHALWPAVRAVNYLSAMCALVRSDITFLYANAPPARCDIRVEWELSQVCVCVPGYAVRYIAVLWCDEMTTQRGMVSWSGMCHSVAIRPIVMSQCGNWCLFVFNQLSTFSRHVSTQCGHVFLCCSIGCDITVCVWGVWGTHVASPAVCAERVTSAAGNEFTYPISLLC